MAGSVEDIFNQVFGCDESSKRSFDDDVVGAVVYTGWLSAEEQV